MSSRDYKTTKEVEVSVVRHRTRVLAGLGAADYGILRTLSEPPRKDAAYGYFSAHDNYSERDD